MLTLSVSATDPEPDVLDRAVAVLRADGVVAYPTDTLYGLAVDPRRPEAVARLFDVKGRPAHAAIPLVAASAEQAQAAGEFGPRERSLARAFWPGPLTLVVPARAGLAPAILGGGQTIAIRVPAHAVVGFCVTATSANQTGNPAPSSAADVGELLRGRIDLLLDAGATTGGPPSTIVELTPDGARLIRAGAIAWDRVLESLQ
jgi:L-threonylcarbamoyladenylate synthase